MGRFIQLNDGRTDNRVVVGSSERITMNIAFFLLDGPVILVYAFLYIVLNGRFSNVIWVSAIIILRVILP